jgi:hypothetical protein
MNKSINQSIDSLHQGIYGSLESCCFFLGYAVGLMQYCILSPCCIYLLAQFIEVVVDVVFKCTEALLDLDISLLDGAQVGSRVLKVVFRSAVYQIIMENSVDYCCDQSAMPDVKRRVSS